MQRAVGLQADAGGGVDVEGGATFLPHVPAAGTGRGAQCCHALNAIRRRGWIYFCIYLADAFIQNNIYIFEKSGSDDPWGDFGIETVTETKYNNNTIVIYNIDIQYVGE